MIERTLVAMRLPSPPPGLVRAGAGLGVAAGVVLLLDASGTLGSMRDALVEMGFDTPRGALIADLLAALAAAAGAGFAAGSRRLAALVGAVVLLVLFRTTLAAEVASDISADAGARIDPSGLALTVVSLAVIGALVGAGAGALASELRAAAASLATTAAEAVRSRTGRRRVGVRAGTVVVALVALVVALPQLGDMLNYEPDTAIVVGAAAAPALDAPATPDGSPTPTMAAPSAPPGMPTSAPWLAWRPTGAGRLTSMTLPAPWTGGSSSTIFVQVYLPPGYSTARRYPVVYVLPWSEYSWARGAQVEPALDGLIDSGSIPPAIYVWASSHGGPFVDSECTDSYDGRSRVETFITTTLVSTIDGQFSTIATPAARSLMGMSQGGFCAAELLTRHPNVFASAISFSGYYNAAIASNQTVNAHFPFGGDASLIASHSPVLVVGGLAADVRRSMFQVVDGNPSQPFYGPQMQAYVAALHSAGIAVDEIADPLGHSWASVRRDLGTALRAVAAWQVKAGLFG